MEDSTKPRVEAIGSHRPMAKMAASDSRVNRAKPLPTRHSAAAVTTAPSAQGGAPSNAPSMVPPNPSTTAAMTSSVG